MRDQNGKVMRGKLPLTAYICDVCKRCNKEKDTHPGQRHFPGICDCPCRDQ